MGAIFNCLQLASMDTIMEGIYWLFLTIDSIIYTFINFLFKLFLTLAQADIFTEDSMNDFIYRIYQLIGVIMLFMLSYAVLRKIVNPDSNDKESVGKIIFNIVKAIILLAIVPSIFTYAFKVQDAILKQNTIGKLILGTSGMATTNGNESPREVINRGGTTMAQGVFEAFLFPTQGDRNVEVIDGLTYEQLSQEVQQTGNFSAYKNVTDKIVDGTLTYYIFVCFIAGLVVAYMLLSYCISLGFRIVKLAFYEVMAPVCIIASILPSQKEMLSRWIKTTLQVFFETFIRIAILYFVIYVLELLKKALSTGTLFPDSEFILKSLGWVAIIMGLVMFMKSAPDLISKLTGLDSGNMGLGIKDQLQKGGLFAAAGFAGGLIAGRGNPFAAFRAARSADKDGNLSGIGAEATRRRDRRDAIQAGGKGTRGRIMVDSMRRRLGLESLSAKQDYKIENDTDYTVKDENNQDVVMDADKRRELEKQKESNNKEIEQINQQVRKDNQIVSDNDGAIQFRSTIKSEALDEIHKDTSDITRDISYTDSTGHVQTITGNYNALKDVIEREIKEGRITGNEVTAARQKLGDAEKSMWKQFVDDATASEAGRNGHTNRKIYTAYAQLMENASDEVGTYKQKRLDAAGNVMRDANGNEILDKILVDEDDGLSHSDRVEDLFARTSASNSQINIAQGQKNREKTALERSNEAIESMFAQREKQIAEKKQEDKYRSNKHASDFNDKRGGGSGGK